VAGSTLAAAAGLRVDGRRLLADLEALARFGHTARGGVSRRAFSPAYMGAQAWLLDRVRAGLDARLDPIGNVVGRVGPPGPAVLGSHIDTVPEGGPLDGAYGVLAALECARTVVEAGLVPRRALEIVAFVDEEGAYLSLLGSRGMVGRLTAEELATAIDPDGHALAEAMRAAGLDPGTALAAARRADALVAYVELHIEQGPLLERLGVPIGVVEGIVGIAETDYHFLGAADHAGTNASHPQPGRLPRGGGVRDASVRTPSRPRRRARSNDVWGGAGHAASRIAISVPSWPHLDSAQRRPETAECSGQPPATTADHRSA
jgi:hydantoinase/carbamoylase family amidase